MGISLVEEDDCNNFRRERVLQKVYKGALKEVRGPKYGESWRSIAGNLESLRLSWEGLRSCESLTGSRKGFRGS